MEDILHTVEQQSQIRQRAERGMDTSRLFTVVARQSTLQGLC